MEKNGSHCCVCHRPLKNPASVEAGIGPICAGKHYLRKTSKQPQNQLDMFRSSYSWGFDGEVVWIIDKDHGRSLTNDMENALIEINAALMQKGLKLIIDYPVMYRDTAEIWDEVAVSSIDLQQTAADFRCLQQGIAGHYSSGIKYQLKSIGERDQAAATAKLINRRKNESESEF
jgi:hypothetical protein